MMMNFFDHKKNDHTNCGKWNPNSKCLQENYNVTNPLSEKESEQGKELLRELRRSRVLKNVKILLEGRQTSLVESFNSTLNRFVPKNKHFSPPVFRSRTYLCAMIWNFRKQNQIKEIEAKIPSEFTKSLIKPILNSDLPLVRDGN